MLTGSEILDQHLTGHIWIEPFQIQHLGTNSYDLTLGPELFIYDPGPLDLKQEPQGSYVQIPEEGYELQPGELYLGVTREQAGSAMFIPCIEGRSSLARLGLNVHITAGFGDLGFQNHWTLELSVIRPLRIYAGVRICQVYFIAPVGEVEARYEGKYMLDTDRPTPSRIWQELQPR